MPELVQLERGKSMMRYLPPKGTAGFAISPVRTYSLLPCPPARSMAIHSFFIWFPAPFYLLITTGFPAAAGRAEKGNTNRSGFRLFKESAAPPVTKPPISETGDAEARRQGRLIPLSYLYCLDNIILPEKNNVKDAPVEKSPPLLLFITINPLFFCLFFSELVWIVGYLYLLSR